jgi:hypothetical protein
MSRHNWLPAPLKVPLFDDHTITLRNYAAKDVQTFATVLGDDFVITITYRRELPFLVVTLVTVPLDDPGSVHSGRARNIKALAAVPGDNVVLHAGIGSWPNALPAATYTSANKVSRNRLVLINSVFIAVSFLLPVAQIS